MSPEAVNRELLPPILERMAPYMRGEREPRLKNWYILTWPGGGTIGARVVDETRIGDLERLIRDAVTAGLPDTRVFTTEGELFGGIGGSARSVGIHLQSENTAALYQVALSGRALLEKVFPGATVLSFPNPEDADLELHAIPDDRRIAELGWDRATVGTIVRTVGEGAWLGEYFDGKSRAPHHSAVQRGRDAGGTGRCAARDPYGPYRAARGPGAAVDGARAARDPPPQPPAHGHAHRRPAGVAVAGERAAQHRHPGATRLTRTAAAGWLAAARRQCR